MSVFTKEELESLLVKTTQENEDLREENQKLLLDATERVKKANDMAEDYHRMFDELFNVIKTQYDAEFKVEDIPKHLS
ncbi:hypothetical protein [Acinetobacter sp. ANC 5414]|uniref:hypothetical protein n=1 Tax=Acinetobacter sp. ANC 5414 TaxID=2731251 RepID=UPI00148F8940|nr:hypothetical protein [Acinetobacter sp. ANC 5414]NNH02203.1 hypothetical protein [Acinetobacter sp. ANC 5414]